MRIEIGEAVRKFSYSISADLRGMADLFIYI